MSNKCNEVVKIMAEDCGSVSAEYLEMGIDSLLDEGVLKEIPVINTVYSSIKFCTSLWDARRTKNLIAFCYHMKDIPSFERIKYVNKAIYEDKHFGERLLLTIEKIDDFDKIEMLKCIFRAYGHRDGIDYNTFRRLCICLENIYIEDLKYLKQCIESKETYFRGEQVIHLSTVGLSAMTIYGGDILNEDVFQILPLGNTFYECVFTDKYKTVI